MLTQLLFFKTAMEHLFEEILQDFSDSDMVGLSIENENNMSKKPIGISYRRKDQLSVNLITSVLENVIQSNAVFAALDNLEIEINVVRLPSGNGKKNLYFLILCLSFHI